MRYRPRVNDGAMWEHMADEYGSEVLKERFPSKDDFFGFLWNQFATAHCVVAGTFTLKTMNNGFGDVDPETWSDEALDALGLRMAEELVGDMLQDRARVLIIREAGGRPHYHITWVPEYNMDLSTAIGLAIQRVHGISPMFGFEDVQEARSRVDWLHYNVKFYAGKQKKLASWWIR